jgi:hypothetical protein
MQPHALEHVEKDVGVVGEALDRVLPAEADRAERRQMDQVIGPLAGQHRAERGEVEQIERIAGCDREPGRSRPGVDPDDHRVGIAAQQLADQVAADESEAARDQVLHAATSMPSAAR